MGSMRRSLLSLTSMLRSQPSLTSMFRSQLSLTFTRSPLLWLPQLSLPLLWLPITTELFQPLTTTTATILPSPSPTTPTLLTTLLQLWLTNCSVKRRKTRQELFCDKKNHFRRDHIGLYHSQFVMNVN